MGIGFVCAEAVLEAGGAVTIAARGVDRLEEARRELAGRFGPGAVSAVAGDVGDPADAERLVEHATAAGEDGLHGLIHAAAVIGPIGPALETDPGDWFDALRINLLGTLLVLRAAASRMRQKGGGRIVLFSGGGATSPFPNYTAYACSKVGVVRLAETLAIELAGEGIAVNAIAPGFVATRMHDATLKAGERAGDAYLERTRRGLEDGGVPPELAARAAVFLLSDRSAGITGRLLAAPWDDWDDWPEHRAEIEGSDLFTLRRIVPRDRGMDWQ